MKNSIKYILQLLLGYERYLYWFSLFTIKTLPWKKNESDFVVFNSLIKGDGLILDIGANIGIMSYHLAISHPQSTIIVNKASGELIFQGVLTNYEKYQVMDNTTIVLNHEFKVIPSN